MSPVKQAALATAIEAQRLRLFELGVTLACMGLALDDVYVPGHQHDAADLETLTKMTVGALDEIAAALDPATLGLPAPARTRESDG